MHSKKTVRQITNLTNRSIRFRKAQSVKRRKLRQKFNRSNFGLTKFDNWRKGAVCAHELQAILIAFANVILGALSASL